jgi:hypothetical protein
MYLQPLSERPTLVERHDRIVIGLADINRYIEQLGKAYERTKDEGVFSVLSDLIAVREKVWAQEDEWRKQEETESFVYFDQLPFSVRLFLLDEGLR